MAFTEIDSEDIEVGKPTKKKLFTAIKDSLDDHEIRLNSVQESASKIEVFNFEVFGFINDYSINELSSIGIFEAPIDFDVTTLTISLQNHPQFLQSTNDGVLGIDLEKSTDNGVTWISILSSLATVPDGISNTGYKSSDALINASNSSLAQGDLIRVSVKSMKNNQGSFNVSVYGEL